VLPLRDNHRHSRRLQESSKISRRNAAGDVRVLDANAGPSLQPNRDELNGLGGHRSVSMHSVTLSGFASPVMGSPNET
jgi:hypothetical protein